MKAPRHESGTRTLGDLLYADRAKTRLSEQHWLDLVRAIAGGDQVALRTLWGQAHRLVFTLMVRITNDRATAEELTVDVFHDVWRRAATYEPANGTVLGWIANQARSRAIDRVRFEQRQKRTPREAETASNVSPPSDPQDLLEASEQGRLVQVALEALAPTEREAIETAFFGGFSHREVAARLDQPLGTIKTRVRSGLAKLREALGMGKG
jgi:RNA polymerase sigma-70 factor (ECF subfamily)